MARDYKNTPTRKRKTTTRKKATRRRTKKPAWVNKLPTWFWFIAGVLATMIIMWIKTHWFTEQVVVKPKDMTPLSSRLENEQSDGSLEDNAKTDDVLSPELKKDPRFTFYERLPKDEIIIPQEALEVEVDKNVKQNKNNKPIESIKKPGSYVIQAGSFQKFSDADRRKAELALLGLESRIQKVSIDEKNWYRVRIGPYSDLEQLNNTRQRLRRGEIDVLIIRTQ